RLQIGPGCDSSLLQQWDERLPDEGGGFHVAPGAADELRRVREEARERAYAAAWEIGEEALGDAVHADGVEREFAGVGQARVEIAQERKLEPGKVNDRRYGFARRDALQVAAKRVPRGAFLDRVRDTILAPSGELANGARHRAPRPRHDPVAAHRRRRSGRITGADGPAELQEIAVGRARAACLGIERQDG